MASAFSHAFVALALGKASPHPIMTWQVLLLGMACSIAPDVNVIGFPFGIRYSDLWGHRGPTHSIFFAGHLSIGIVRICNRRKSSTEKNGIGVYLFLCAASHGVLDAMTNGGLGVAFFPVRSIQVLLHDSPIAVSPIDIEEFFTRNALVILASEATWIWLPTVAGFFIIRGLQYVWSHYGLRSQHRKNDQHLPPYRHTIRSLNGETRHAFSNMACENDRL